MAVTFLTSEDENKFVKSVNGTSPDENGNVEITIPEGGTVTEEQIASAVEEYMEENPVSGGGLTAEQITALDNMFKIAAYTVDASDAYAAFKTAFGIEDTHEHSYTSAVTTAATCTTDGVRTYTCSCGDSYTESIPATGHSYVDGVCTVCGATDPTYNPDVTLTSISATYSGGEVAAGTAVSDLTGIVVTAHYSDGTSEAVTGYTLSGTIAEGSNTITVSYGGMTTTFTVTGVAESGGETNDTTAKIAEYGCGWTNGNRTVANENMCYTEHYDISDVFENQTGTYAYVKCVVKHSFGDEYQSTYFYGNVLKDGDYFDYKNPTNFVTADGSEKQISFKASDFVGSTVSLSVSLQVQHIDDCYMYNLGNGRVIFAGKNTPYYNMANIDGTPYTP